MSLFSTLKNVRRRTVEAVLETVGASEKTVDEEFDLLQTKFDDVLKDLNECAAAVSSALIKQKSMFSDCQELAKCLARIYTQNDDDQAWPNAKSKLKHSETAKAYKDCWDNIHNVIRSSSAFVTLEDGVDPIKDYVTELGPTIQQEQAQRSAMLIDYDSYRRRLKALTTKRDTAEAQGKGGSTANAETIADIQKYEGKVQGALDAYSRQNAQVKDDMTEGKGKHDELVDELFIVTITCQVELFRRSAEALESILAQLPQEKVALARERVEGLIGKGGVQIEPKPKSKLEKGFAVATGKTVSSSIAAKDASADTQQSATIPNRNPFADDRQTPGGNDPSSSPASESPNPNPNPGNPFGDDSSSSPQASPQTARTNCVVALFDHKGDADDELDFMAGDLVEVLEKSDSGWWKGRCHGKEGLFPYNYVKSD